MFALTELEVQALLLSLRVGFWSVLVSLPFGIAVAWLLARANFRGKFLTFADADLRILLSNQQQAVFVFCPERFDAGQGAEMPG